MGRAIHTGTRCPSPLRAGLCAVVLVSAAQTTWAQKDESPPTAQPASPPLQLSFDAKAKGGGRAAVPISRSGGPDAGLDELRAHPILPTLHCAKATVVAATKTASPVVVPGARRKAQRLSCELRYRGETKSFGIAVSKPSAGLYASLSNHQPSAGDAEIKLQPFVVGKEGAVGTPRKFQVSSSAGTLSTASSGEVSLTLPTDDAPRAVAIAFSDGKQGGAIFFPFEGKTDLPVKTPRKTKVRVRIAGAWFGPVDATGRRTTLPITVPPGIRDAVVQSIGAKGNISETYADLKTPELPRIAAVAASKGVSVGGTTAIYVALATARGFAESSTVTIQAQTEAGTLSTPVYEGPGLWRVDLKAGQKTGVAEVKISVAESPNAGEALVQVEVGAAAASKFAFEIEERAFAPGELITGKVRAQDAFGNSAPLTALRLQLAGKTIKVVESEGAIGFEAKLPEKLTRDRTLSLVASVGAASETYLIKTVAGPTVSAEIDADVDSRQASLAIRLTDRFGNPSDATGVTLIADAGTTSKLVSKGDITRARVTAKEGALSSGVRVMLGERKLAEETIRFEPPRTALVLGAYADGAWTSNGGDLSVARGAMGLGLRRSFGPIETALLVGLEAFTSTETVEADVGGSPEPFVRKIRGIAVPVAIRGRMRVARRLGARLALVLLPVATSTRVAMEDSGESFKAWTTGFRAQVSGDYRLGPGRVVLGLSYGRVELSEGPVIGDIDGMRVYAGYELWPLILRQ